MKIAFFDAKPYDKVAFDKFCGENDIKIKYFETKLNEDTVFLARRAKAVCVFVNDTINNAEFMNWRLNTPSFIVNEEEKKVSPKKYIYWSKDSEPISEAKKVGEK